METLPESAAAPTVITIDEFCKRNRISKFTYHKLKGQDRGPREMKLNGVIRITLKAEADWQRAREMPKDPEERLNRRQEMARSRAAKQAGKASVKSTRHVSNRKARRNA